MIAENVKKEGLYLSIRHAQMQYRHEFEHAPAMFAPTEGKDSSLMKHAQMQYRPEIEHALANFAFVAVLTSSFASLAFSKYRRAQIALFQAYTASVASMN